MSIDFEGKCMNYINDVREKPAGELFSTLKDPNTGKSLLAFHSSSSEQIERVLAVSTQVFKSGAWSDLPIEERVKQLLLMADGVEEVEKDLGLIEATHTGIPVALMSELAAGCKFCIRDFANNAVETLSAHVYDGLHGKLMSVHQPLGPCAVIAPWNAPCATIISKVAAALLAGCTVIIKPSEHAPVSLTLLVEGMLRKCSIASGVLQLIHGGPEVGKALVADPRIRCVQFTGSIPSGRLVGQACGAQLKPMLLELGGSNCAIIFEDANLSHAVTSLVKGITFLNGQWCMGIGRIIVQESIYLPFLTRLIEALKLVKVGVSTDPSVAMDGLGPLAFEEHCNHLKRIISGLIAHGGVAHTSVTIPSDNHCYLSPTIISGVPHSMCTEYELFGPLATYHSFKDENEVVEMANSSQGKLAGFVFSTDVDKAMRVSKQLATGLIMVNGVHTDFYMSEGKPSPPMHFWNAAGYGIDGTIDALLNFFSRRRLFGPNGPSN